MTSELVGELFTDWVKAEASVIAEFSGDMTTSYRVLIVRARERAESIGLPWSDDFIPEHVNDIASCWGDEPNWMEES